MPGSKAKKSFSIAIVRTQLLRQHYIIILSKWNVTSHFAKSFCAGITLAKSGKVLRRFKVRTGITPKLNPNPIPIFLFLFAAISISFIINVRHLFKK